MFGTKVVDRHRTALGTGQVTFKDGTVAHVKAQDQSQAVLADGRKVASNRKSTGCAIAVRRGSCSYGTTKAPARPPPAS